jgi:hypothetical protein
MGQLTSMLHAGSTWPGGNEAGMQQRDEFSCGRKRWVNWSG